MYINEWELVKRNTCTFSITFQEKPKTVFLKKKLNIKTNYHNI